MIKLKSSTIKLILACFILSSGAYAQGKIIKIDNFKSQYVKERNVEIWLPAEYFDNPGQKFPVLYMHDGQNVFNPETSSYGTAWEADEAARIITGTGAAHPFIIVASWCTDVRFLEYFPEKAVQYLSPDDKAAVDELMQKMGMSATSLLGDEYLKFLVTELKPYVDSKYRTLPDAKNTSISGSSMGGLISMYAICEYPGVFGQAACVSTHWPVLFDNSNMAPSEAIRNYMKNHLPSPVNHRFYFDYGTATLDQYYEVHQNKVDELMQAKGYSRDENWVTMKFEGAEHNEKSWQARMDIILGFLYGKS